MRAIFLCETDDKIFSVYDNETGKTKRHEKIGYDDGFCKHCGRQQKDFHYMGKKFIGIKRQAICKKCSHKQEDAFLDAMRTKHCTFCGSDKLEWKCIGIVN